MMRALVVEQIFL